MKTTTITSSLLEIATASSTGYQNPLLKYVKFIFCDDKPNQNKQGVEYEDFPEVAQSAIGTPIKMRYVGEKIIGNHMASIPVGHITGMTENTLDDGTHQLIADGVLFASEYPEEIDYLETAFAAKKAPGISFEIRYNDKVSKIIDGVTWIKGVVTQAATFVRNPAYGNRTALLALASNSSLTDEDLAEGLTALANEIRPKNANKGGNNTVEKELEELKTKVATLEKELADEKAKNTDLETAKASLTSEKDELQKKVEAQSATLAQAAREKLIEARTKAIAEAGVKMETDSEKLGKKQEFWAKMDDESFAEYVDDLKAAVAAAKPINKLEGLKLSSASKSPSRITPGEDEDKSIAGLKGRLGRLSRIAQEEDEE